MIDVAKVADLVGIFVQKLSSLSYILKEILCYILSIIFQVLLLIDASFGFEMEIFEFLNIAQVHGFPKIMGVLTHLDLLKNNKSLKKLKKSMKQRFWTEVYQVIYLSFLFYLLTSSLSNRLDFFVWKQYLP